LSGGNTWTTVSITSDPTGVYVVTSSSPNKIVLTKNLTENNSSYGQCNSTYVSVNSMDVYTITLTR